MFGSVYGLSLIHISEKDRDHRDRYKMASYIWAPDSAHLLFDASGSLFLYDLKNGTGIEIGHTGSASGDDPKFSPNGEYLSFVRDHGLSVLKLANSPWPANAVADSPEQTAVSYTHLGSSPDAEPVWPISIPVPFFKS